MVVGSRVGWLTIREAAEYAHCSEITIRRAIRSGKLTGHCPAGRWLFDVADLDNWIRASGTGDTGDVPVGHDAAPPET